MKVIKIKMEKIVIPENQREVRNIERFCSSLGDPEIGQIYPILVKETGENLYELVSGLHRLTAAKQKGWEEIEAIILEGDQLTLELIKIHENLVRSELTELEQSEYILRQEQILEAKGLRAKHGRPKKGDTVSPFKTTKDIANYIGCSERTVQRARQIAENILPEAKENIRGTEVANSTTDLLELARLFKNKQNKWLLKGGYALELYLHDIARTTKDIDLSIPEKRKISKEKIREMLQEEAEKDIKDYFQFLIGTSYQDLHQPVYGGWRYPVEAKLDNRTFTKFHLDVGIGDEIITKPIWQKGHNLLSFAGILPAKVAVIPREQQFAEKIHSYTFPKDKRNNSRVKDLLDLVLLIQHGKLRKIVLKQSIEKTFQNRGTHHLPKELELPPSEWENVYEKLASECKSSKVNINEAFRYLDKYWQRIFY